MQEWGKLGTLTQDEVLLGDMYAREDNIKIDFEGIGYRMDLSQYKARGLAVLNTVNYIWFH